MRWGVRYQPMARPLAHWGLPRGDRIVKWQVVDNVTGDVISQPFASEESAAHICRGLNMERGAGGRFKVVEVPGPAMRNWQPGPLAAQFDPEEIEQLIRGAADVWGYSMGREMEHMTSAGRAHLAYRAWQIIRATR
jgi:hypothetical protein